MASANRPCSALIAGVRRLQSGSIHTLGGDMATRKQRDGVAARIAYMPQGLGRNLYPLLSVVENIDFFGRLFGQSPTERRDRIARLLQATGLAPFRDRPAGKLSGGMKQKLSLCCSLIHDPDLLILDEPTTGVDPLSRRQFWTLIDEIRAERAGMTVLVSTAYMEEAERFDRLVAIDAGRVLADGTTRDILATHRHQAADRRLCRAAGRRRRSAAGLRPAGADAGWRPARDRGGEPHPPVRRLHRGGPRQLHHRQRGEIFGFLGSNGCGKTTTMKMLTGLLGASEGRAELLGRPVEATDLSTRMRVGYMSQSFSLYEELTVRANLELHAHLYRVPGGEVRSRVDQALRQFDLAEVADAEADGPAARYSATTAAGGGLPAPSGGADPRRADLGRRSRRTRPVLAPAGRAVAPRWRHHLRLDPFHERGRAMRPDLADARRTRARHRNAERGPRQPKPRPRWRTPSLPTCEEADGSAAAPTPQRRLDAASAVAPPPPRHELTTSLARIWAFARREILELLRDHVRLAFALVGPLILMITFGYGITFDVENLSFAVFDRDQSAAEPATDRELRRLALLPRAAARCAARARSIAGCAPASCAWRSTSRPASDAICSTRAGPRSRSSWTARRPFRAETVALLRAGDRPLLCPGPRAPQLRRRPGAHVAAGRPPLSLQPGFPQRVRDHAWHRHDPPHLHPCDADRARDRARAGDRLDQQSLRVAGDGR